MRTAKELHSMLSMGLEPVTPDEGTEPIYCELSQEAGNETSQILHDTFVRLMNGTTPAISKPMKTAFPDFHFFVQRDFCDDEIEVAIEVKEFRASGKNGNLDHRDPSYDPGYVEFGEAYSVPPGTPITLTKRELEQTEAAFWNQ